MSGDGVSDDMSQPWPTSAMYEPMCEVVEAIHSARKSGRASGLHVDRDGPVIPGPESTVGPLGDHHVPTTFMNAPWWL